MTVLYPKLCYNEMCYKGTALCIKLFRGGSRISGKGEREVSFADLISFFSNIP